jgi:hypothetical protein
MCVVCGCVGWWGGRLPSVTAHHCRVVVCVCVAWCCVCVCVSLCVCVCVNALTDEHGEKNFSHLLNSCEMIDPSTLSFVTAFGHLVRGLVPSN